MAMDANSQVNRRGFLKGAAVGAAGAAALTVPGVAPADAAAQLPDQARPAFTPEQAAQTLAPETAPLPDEPDVMTVDDPTAYLYRTAMNAFRSRRRRAAVAVRRAFGASTSDDDFEQIESLDATVRALAGLSRQQRAAVVLMDLLGYSSEEAARMLGVRASTVRMHASRAHAALRKTMGGDT